MVVLRMLLSCKTGENPCRILSRYEGMTEPQGSQISPRLMWFPLYGPGRLSKFAWHQPKRHIFRVGRVRYSVSKRRARWDLLSRLFARLHNEHYGPQVGLLENVDVSLLALHKIHAPGPLDDPR